ncbi:helix-turn-helix domain-containing protein [Sorangium sp. So ce726]|uniref:helix-turn-helix domain-containing protein n=1 Tax=Sorangium sp. So ce726 TaxID=3133319 RepID=UPI003F6221CD
MPLVPTPPATPRGYSAVELARAAGVSTGTIKHWFAEGLMDKPVFRGRRTTYGREHLVRALAIKKLREQNLLLPEIKRRLAAIPLEEMAKEVLPPEPSESAAPGAGERADTEELGRAWRRVELMPGLELHVRADAGAVIHRMAAEIREKYGCEREEGRR